MLHKKGKRVSSFSFPNFPQNPIPGYALPPPQMFMQKAVTNRGRPITASSQAHRNRGKPFSIVWNNHHKCPLATFGNTGSFLLPWMDYPTFQLVINHVDPLRHCSILYWQWFKANH